jgi:hypothetical protein
MQPAPDDDALPPPPPRGEVLVCALLGVAAGVAVFVAHAELAVAGELGRADPGAATQAFMLFWGPFTYLLAAGAGALMGSMTGLAVGLSVGLAVRSVRDARLPEAWTPDARKSALTRAGLAIVALLVGLVFVVPGLLGSRF